jgi:hypothetical protein
VPEAAYYSNVSLVEMKCNKMAITGQDIINNMLVLSIGMTDANKTSTRINYKSESCFMTSSQLSLGKASTLFWHENDTIVVAFVVTVTVFVSFLFDANGVNQRNQKSLLIFTVIER